MDERAAVPPMSPCLISLKIEATTRSRRRAASRRRPRSEGPSFPPALRHPEMRSGPDPSLQRSSWARPLCLIIGARSTSRNRRRVTRSVGRLRICACSVQSRRADGRFPAGTAIAVIPACGTGNRLRQPEPAAIVNLAIHAFSTLDCRGGVRPPGHASMG